MLENLLAYLNNWFLVRAYVGDYKVVGGQLVLPQLQEGQYFRIVGSVFNDGLHRYGFAAGLTDEEFHGAVWALAVPAAIVSLADEIEQWQTKYGATVTSPFQSESFGGASFTKRSEEGTSWQSVFRVRMERWRKI